MLSLHLAVVKRDGAHFQATRETGPEVLWQHGALSIYWLGEQGGTQGGTHKVVHKG